MSRVFVYKRVIGVLDCVGRLFSRVRVNNVDVFDGVRGMRVIVVANHVSDLDPVVLGGVLGRRVRLRVLAKDGLFRVPVVGSVLNYLGMVPVSRGSESAHAVVDAGVQVLCDGDVLAVYPEGTVMSELGKFKTGFARVAIEFDGDVVIVPVGQWGVQEVYPAHDFSVRKLVRGFVKRPVHGVSVGDPIVVDDALKDLGVEYLVSLVRAKVADEVEVAQRLRV